MNEPRDAFDQAMRLGHSAAWDQLWDSAIHHYRAALKEFPDEPTALSSLGYALLQADRLEEALGQYQRAAALSPGDPVAPEKCGEIFERQGRLNDAAQTYLAVAEIHLKRRDVKKATENWTRVVRLTPDNLAAHSRLALAFERTSQPKLAAREYIEVGRIFQRARDTEKATAAVTRALQLDPQSAEGRDALDRLRRGVALAVPERPTLPEAASGPAGPAGPAAPEADSGGTPADGVDHHANPLEDALEPALGRLAELLFEEDLELAKKPGSMGALTRATGKLSGDRARRAVASRHLGQAITSYSTGEVGAAIKHYEEALNAGFDNALVSFALGALLLRQKRMADAGKRFRAALNHPDVAVGAMFGLAQAELQANQPREAVNHLLGALRRLDQGLNPPERHDVLAEAYESLTEGLQGAAPADLTALAGSLTQFLSGAGWHDRLVMARRQLDGSALDGQAVPLADLLAVPGASQVVESMRRIESYMGRQLWATAMEEAYYALGQAPTHLPVHIRIAEILSAEEKQTAAIEKYRAVAETYRIRGELTRATRITQEVLRLSPLDVTMRSWLIELLVEQHKIEEALQQFTDLADTYYQLADLEAARTTYADALMLAQQNNLAKEWRVNLLHKMGDIDLQRLNWREAQNVYEQIKNLAPDDGPARATLIDLLFRLGNSKQGLVETDAYLRQLLAGRDMPRAIEVLAELVETHPHESGLLARLARLYADTGRPQDAIVQYDRLGEMQLQAGQIPQAVETIRTILSLGPEDTEQYQQLLDELQR
ncbi:MAG: tetratricopeptide repeat protein [Anaerolineales bacterium]|nr:tetratricopeptide repeat protein [Anaerolineales bacterium]